MNHQHCPECDGNTEVVNTEFHRDIVERVRICQECPTQYTVSYADPVVGEVMALE